MRKQIDHFLLGLLWLLAITLGACFWFNTKYGFNIFSLPHWQYLGQMQASRVAIMPGFYISMIIIVVLMIGGLYMIVRPRFRKINFAHQPQEKQPAQRPELPQEVPTTVPVTSTAPAAYTSSARPPRLTIPASNHATPRPAVTQAPITTQIPTTPISAPAATPVDFTRIEDIFKSNGYTVKKTPRIGGFKPALFAIGSDENLWIGGVGIEPERLYEAMEKLNNIFVETLEDITINIHGFIIKPKITASSQMDGMMQFDSENALGEYMNSHRNRELTDGENEDFAAYSEYIDTVADYFGKS